MMLSGGTYGQNNADIMTAEHLLQSIYSSTADYIHDALRRDIWPEQCRHHDCRASTAALPTTYMMLSGGTYGQNQYY